MFPPQLAISAMILLTLIFILSIIIILQRPKQSKHDQKQPPPGPPAWPVIGNLHLLGKTKFPHRTLQSLATKYGPIMSLQLGQVHTVVISSGKAVEEILKKNDAVFASRPKFQATDIMSYGSKGVAFQEYGPYWRNMRKLCTLHLLSVSKAESFEALRREELQVAVESLERAAAAREIVDVTRVVANLVESIVYKMVLGVDNKDKEYDLNKEIVHEGRRLTGAFNVADYVPWLGGLDLQGLKRAFKKIFKAYDEVLEKIMKEHEEAINSNTKKGRQDFLHILLSLMHHCVDGQNYEIDRNNIKAILLDMIAGSLDTSASTIMWALSELLRHPRVMKTLQDELDTVIGMKKMVDEIDLSKLNYLEMVIKETLRLHPGGPIIPRESTKDVNVVLDGNGYYIKKGTRVMINIWAIGRDSKEWSDVEMFCPEKFNNKDINFRGLENFEFIPFGLGRRGCPGTHLGLITIKIVLAQLIHSFSWELPWGLTPNELDMSERYGLTLPRAKNLLAVPTSRIPRMGRQNKSL